MSLMSKKIALSGVLMTLSLAACHAVPQTRSVQQVQVAKSLQGKQCQQQGWDVAMLRQQLEAKHIHVFAQSIGYEAAMYPQVCGAPDGRVAVFNIDQKQWIQAQSLGFVLYHNQ